MGICHNPALSLRQAARSAHICEIGLLLSFYDNYFIQISLKCVPKSQIDIRSALIRPGDNIWDFIEWVNIRGNGLLPDGTKRLLNQYWLIINILGKKSEGIFNAYPMISYHKNVFEKYILKMTFSVPVVIELTQWGQVMHICIIKVCHHWFKWWLVACF